MEARPAGAVLGVFVGGRGRRLGGVDKSSLPAPDGAGTLLLRALSLGQALPAVCAVVGTPPGGFPEGLPADVAHLQDDPPGIGPLGGLGALLGFAAGRPALALACDMPFVRADLLRRLLHAPSAPVVAPRDPATGKWDPLCARYDSGGVLPALRAAVAAGERSLQPLLGRLAVAELPLGPPERAQLRDWDRPEDLL